MAKPTLFHIGGGTDTVSLACCGVLL